MPAHTMRTVCLGGKDRGGGQLEVRGAQKHPPLHCLGCLPSFQLSKSRSQKQTLIRKSHLFPNKLHYSAKYLDWISFDSTQSQFNIVLGQLNLLKGVLLMASYGDISISQKN